MMVEHWFLKHKEQIKKLIVYIIIMINVIIVASMFLTKQLTGKASILGYRPYFIMSGSMEPTIMTHQFVLAVPVDPDDVAVGDIITYDRYLNEKQTIKKTIIHRVIEVDENMIVCKGDNNENADKPISSDQIGYKIILY